MEAVEKQSKWIAAGTTLAVHALILLLFIVVTNTTPIPPYPDGTGPGLEINFGNFVEGMGDVEYDNMGNNEPAKVSETQPEHSSENNPNENDYITNDAEESVTLNNKKPVVEKNNKEVKPELPVEQKESEELLNALKAFKASKNKTSGTPGGHGNSNEKGNKGVDTGNPDTDGNDPSGLEISLKGRKVIKPPDIADDSQEEGKVVVAIVVDASGKVISAEPGQRGSTTTASILWTKARQAALSTKFNPSPDGTPEQRGTIKIVFALSH